MNTVPIGHFVESVQKWNPRKDGAGTFTYVDLSSVDQTAKAVTEPTTVAASEAPSRARQLIATGDVLVSTVRPNLNAVAYVDPDLDGATASTGFCVLRPRPNELDGRYLFHWVRTGQFIGRLLQRATGASYPAVSDKIVTAAPIPLPPIEEQRRIAAVLDAAEALRTKRRLTLTKLGTLTQATFIDMFGDPVANPFGWRDDRVLADVADVRSGITKGRKTGSASLTPVPYLAVVNVQDGYIQLDPLKSIEATAAEIEKYALQIGDILLTEGGDPDKLGRGAVWHGQVEPCIHQNHVFRVRMVDDNMMPEFLSRLLASQRGKRYFLRMAKQTTGIASINMTQLRAFPLLEPPRATQDEFLSRISCVQAVEGSIKRSLVQLDALCAAIQQRAFRGEL